MQQVCLYPSSMVDPLMFGTREWMQRIRWRLWRYWWFTSVIGGYKMSKFSDLVIVRMNISLQTIRWGEVALDRDLLHIMLAKPEAGYPPVSARSWGHKHLLKVILAAANHAGTGTTTMGIQEWTMGERKAASSGTTRVGVKHLHRWSQVTEK